MGNKETSAGSKVGKGNKNALLKSILIITILLSFTVLLGGGYWIFKEQAPRPLKVTSQKGGVLSGASVSLLIQFVGIILFLFYRYRKNPQILTLRVFASIDKWCGQSKGDHSSAHSKHISEPSSVLTPEKKPSKQKSSFPHNKQIPIYSAKTFPPYI